MKSLASFLKQCIAEVLVEQVPRPRKRMTGLRSLVKHCVAEVIVEPGMSPERLHERVKKVIKKRVRIVGNPKTFNMSKLIKECTLEVLKERVISEAFDPSSEGPNVPQENPYPAWNAKMAQMEEEKTKYDETETFQEIRDREDPKGLNHNLTLECIHCGRKATCRCSKPKNLFKGVCESCAKVHVKEGKWPVRYTQEEDAIGKVKKEVYEALGRQGFRQLGDTPREYMEYYLNGFVTVSISIGYNEQAAIVERYYDSEMVDNIPGHHVNAKIPIPPQYDPNVVKKLIAVCVKLKNDAAGDESIFGGIDDLQERVPAMEWKCPHCSKKAGILLEVESPADYVAFADCEHCGKEISDPKLDRAIYEVVMKHYRVKRK